MSNPIPNKPKLLINSILFGGLFAAVMCFVLLYFQKVMMEHISLYYILLFVNSVPFTIQLYLKLPNLIIYILYFPYFIGLTYCCIRLDPKLRQLFILCVCAIHLILAILYNSYLINQAKPFGEIIKIFF